MNNLSTTFTVDDVVVWALVQEVDVSSTGLNYTQRATFITLFNDRPWFVGGTVNGAVCDDPPHPVLQDFLLESEAL